MNRREEIKWITESESERGFPTQREDGDVVKKNAHGKIARGDFNYSEIQPVSLAAAATTATGVRVVLN